MSLFSIESFLKQQRIKKISPSLPYGGVLVDVGCDNPPFLINKVKQKMDFCIGIDAEVDNQVNGNVELKKVFLQKKIPVESELANVITMLAVLEHLEHPRAIAMELYRILKPGGVLLLTVPSGRNKKILELLAFLGIVDKKMIAQHKYYFTQAELRELFSEVGFRTIDITPFQLGLNTFVRAIK